MRQGFRAFQEANPGSRPKCAEVGVWEGGNAIEFVNGLKPAHAWLVDCWGDFSTQPTTVAELGIDKDPEFWDKIYVKVKKMFAECPNVTLVRAWSHQAIHVVPDELDFVYIDADHTEEGCRRDIDLWLPKVREGGWLIGDDYSWPGVRKAVDDYVSEKKIKSFQASENGTQWWFVKGEFEGQGNAIETK